MTELLPCPFCGGRSIGNDNAGSPYFYCESCDVSQSTFDSFTDAIAAWNTRTPTPVPNAGAVRVKPLVWEPIGNPNGRYRLHSTVSWARNTCPYGPYFIGLSSSCKDGEYSWDGPANTGKRGFADPESAKAAAQADYDARILSAIELTPDPRDTVIARLVEALEAMMHSVCGPCGFADAVRHNSSLAYPWPSMDIAELKARAALAAAKEVQV